ncbi:MAG: hypothetical protein LAP85_17825 [Acidobacteriia bacterium]|nr:hypothetical protein [Terriglobia bacterium]
MLEIGQPEKEDVVPHMRTIKRYSLISGWILILGILALGVIQSGDPANLVDPSGFLFVLVGGMALAMISFPGAEIRCALRDAAGTRAKETDFRSSAFFWEAAGRSFWIMGVLRSILHLMIFFGSIGTVEFGTWQLIIKELSQSLATALYGLVLAVICFIPCWKLTGKLRSRPLAPTGVPGPTSIGHPGWRFGIAFGYVLLFLFLAPWFLKLYGPTFKPALLVVVGGTIALMLSIRGANSGPTLSTAFAAMGIIGLLIGSIQMQGHVAGAFAFLLSSGFTPLLGMVLVGAPLEDRAIRTGRVATPSAFSRVAWYVFPLLALIFLVPMFFVLTLPGLG